MNVDFFDELKKTDDVKKQKNIKKALDGGAVIPCRDGVIIGDNVSVGKNTVILSGCILTGNTVIGENNIIGPDTVLHDMRVGTGNTLLTLQGFQAEIRNDCNIGPFTQIRPGSVISSGVHLGNFVEVKNSAIGDKTSVSHLTYVGDSDVGKNVNFGCGCVTVNYTGKQKFRCTVKDNCFVGCNTNLVAPVTLGENSYTAAGSTITEDVPSDTLAIARARQVNKPGWHLKIKEGAPLHEKK